jgi:hypothetical protein
MEVRARIGFARAYEEGCPHNVGDIILPKGDIVKHVNLLVVAEFEF